MLLLRLCYPQTSNLFPPGLQCQPAYSPPPVSLCSIEPQTTLFQRKVDGQGHDLLAHPLGELLLITVFQGHLKVTHPQAKLGFVPFASLGFRESPKQPSAEAEKGLLG